MTLLGVTVVGHCRCDGRKPIVESSTKYNVPYIVRNWTNRASQNRSNRNNTMRIERDIASAKWQHSKNWVSQYCTRVDVFGITRKRLQIRFDFKKNYANTCRSDWATNASSYPPKSHARAKSARVQGWLKTTIKLPKRPVTVPTCQGPLQASCPATN